MTQHNCDYCRIEGLIARFRAALRLLGNDHITPAGRRVLEKVLDAETDSRDE